MQTNRIVSVSVALFVVVLCCATASGRVIYVDGDANGLNNGSSWADAYYYLQDALMMAAEGDEIRLAQGLYKPDDFVLSRRPNLGRGETFQLKSGVTIKGGYGGLGETNPDVRDVKSYETVLSGDRNGDDGLLPHGDKNDNCFHVVTVPATCVGAVLDGFAVTGGYAVSSSTLYECGGGIYCLGEATLVNCKVSGNDAVCGGGMCNDQGRAVVLNCTFSENSAVNGGGIYLVEESRPMLNNCTLTGNSANVGGGIYNLGSNPTVINSILWHNTALSGAQIYNDGSTPVITYSNVQGGWPGDGNIDADPLFADPNSNDYHLKSQAGRYDPNTQSWTLDDVTSPCIDAGDPMNPIMHEPFPNGGRVNMGAYGGTAEASKSYFGEAVCETIVAGDINGDCRVDFADFRIMGLHWLQESK